MARYTSQSVVISKRIADAYLAALSARPAAALLTTPLLHLSKDPGVTITPTSDSAVLALGEADCSGYTGGGYAVTLVAPTNAGTQAQAAIMDQVILRTLGTPDVGNQVYAWWIDDAAGFVCGEVFAGGGIPLDLPGDYLDLLAVVPVSLLPPFAA